MRLLLIHRFPDVSPYSAHIKTYLMEIIRSRRRAQCKYEPLPPLLVNDAIAKQFASGRTLNARSLDVPSLYLVFLNISRDVNDC